MNYTDSLANLGETYIKEAKPDNLVCAFAGGSVGRGEADEYSDLDLNFYVSDSNVESSSNIIFRNQIIQLHIHSLPTLDHIYLNPWEYRFILEARSIHDPNRVFKQIQEVSSSFFKSTNGEALIRRQAKETIQERINWLNSCVHNQEWIAAGLAARSAVIDACFYYSFFHSGSLSTGGLFNSLSDLHAFADIKSAIFIDPPDVNVLLDDLKTYRVYLRDIYGCNFALDAVQDELIIRKTKRYQKCGELNNLFWQIAGEAFWCYLSVAQGVSFDVHYLGLPKKLQLLLNNLGYRPYTSGQLKSYRDLVVSIITEAEKIQ